MVKKNQEQKPPKDQKTEEEKIESILTNSKNINRAKKTIAGLSKYKRQELKAALVSYDTTGYYKLPNKLSDKDIKKLLDIIEEEDKKITLYKTNDLRPIAWSKTVTVFDVYETDEENFVPYVSPLATVGVVEGSDSSTDMANIGEAGTGIENPEEVPGITSTGGLDSSITGGGSSGSGEGSWTDKLFGWLGG